MKRLDPAHEVHMSNDVLLRLPEVKRLSGLSRSTIYRLEAQGDFPARVRLSERATAWRSTEVFSWLAARPRAASERRDAA